MFISSEVAGLAISAAKSVIRLAKRADVLKAEQATVEGKLVVPLPTEDHVPGAKRALKDLAELLERTAGSDPDPLGEDRATIESVLHGQPTNEAVMKRMYRRHLPDRLAARAREAAAVVPGRGDSDSWEAAFVLEASATKKGEISYEWRLALLVADVLIEFGAEHTGLLTKNSRTERILTSVLTRVAIVDPDKYTQWSPLIEHALRGALNGFLDARADLDGDNALLEDVLGALAKARDAVDNPDDFLIGLFRGKGWATIAGVALELGSERLRENDRSALRQVLADVLSEAATFSKGDISFERFFHDHWGDLAAAAVRSVHRIGPKLFEKEPELLREVLMSAIATVASIGPTAFTTPKTLVALVDGILDTVAAHPDLVTGDLREKWAKKLIHTVLKVVATENVAGVLSGSGVERITITAIGSLADAPELLERGETFGRILSSVLKSVGAMETLRGDTAERIASAVLGGALRGIADDPRLADRELGPLLSDILDGVGGLLAGGKIRDVQADALVTVVLEAMATNAELFVELEKDLAGAALKAVVKATEADSTKLLVGTTLVALVRRVIEALASHGRLLTENVPAVEIPAKLGDVVVAGLRRTESELGRRMSKADLPDVIAGLIISFARGELGTLDPNDPNFKRIFATIADRLHLP